MKNAEATLIAGKLDTGEGALAYWIGGRSGAAWCVISHGGALDHRDFLPLAAALSGDWSVLLWDLPGHGQSQPRPDPFTAAGCAEQLATLMDHLDIATAVHVGFSFGGVAAQLLARRRPDLVSGLVAYACFTPHLLPPLIEPGQVDAVVEGRFDGLSWPQIKADFAARCCLTEAGRDAVCAAMEASGRDGFLAMTKALLGASDYAPDFRLGGPVATLIGAMDSNGAPLIAAMAAYKQAYPDALEIVLANAGHCAHLDQPAAFLNAAKVVFQRLRPSLLSAAARAECGC